MTTTVNDIPNCVMSRIIENTGIWHVQYPEYTYTPQYGYKNLTLSNGGGPLSAALVCRQFRYLMSEYSPSAYVKMIIDNNVNPLEKLAHVCTVEQCEEILKIMDDRIARKPFLGSDYDDDTMNISDKNKYQVTKETLVRAIKNNNRNVAKHIIFSPQRTTVCTLLHALLTAVECNDVELVNILWNIIPAGLRYEDPKYIQNEDGEDDGEKEHDVNIFENITQKAFHEIIKMGSIEMCTIFINGGFKVNTFNREIQGDARMPFGYYCNIDALITAAEHGDGILCQLFTDAEFCKGNHITKENALKKPAIDVLIRHAESSKKQGIHNILSNIFGASVYKERHEYAIECAFKNTDYEERCKTDYIWYLRSLYKKGIDSGMTTERMWFLGTENIARVLEHMTIEPNDMFVPDIV